MMSEHEFYSRPEPSLAVAWARVFLQFMDKPDRTFTPFMVSIAAGPDGNPVEDEDLRDALDATLVEIEQQNVEVVAKTIFPAAIWRRVKGDRQELYRYYREYLPDYVAMAPNKNSHGLYFARLIGFGLDPKTGNRVEHMTDASLPEDGNQLEFIIKACKKGAIPSELQASIYDPVRDQVLRQYSFPCLQHVSFIRDNEAGTLSLNAFYALQSFFVKAYGNWLGLMRLGAFVASQTGLRFERLNCFAGKQKMRSGSRPKPGVFLDRLKDFAATCVAETPAEVTA
jgi:hypothetical protein